MTAPAEAAPQQLRHNSKAYGNGSPSILRRGEEALRLLVDAFEYANDVGRNVWDFAVEIDALRHAGFTNNEFRWLVCKGYADHARDTTLPGEESRTFRRSRLGPGLVFSGKAAFVLTEAGYDFATAVLVHAEGNGAHYRNGHSQAKKSAGNLVKPRWDRDRQELRVGEVLVKQFKVPAANQERILAAFEEDGWPVHIDDPLPQTPEQDPKRRLHDTINSLNRNQKRAMIRFVGDGTGQGVRWRYLHPPENGKSGHSPGLGPGE